MGSWFGKCTSDRIKSQYEDFWGIVSQDYIHPPIFYPFPMLSCGEANWINSLNSQIVSHTEGQR